MAERPSLEDIYQQTVKRPSLDEIYSSVKKPDEGGGFWSSAGDFFKSIGTGAAKGLAKFGAVQAGSVSPEEAIIGYAAGRDPLKEAQQSGQEAYRAFSGAIERNLPAAKSPLGESIGETFGEPTSYAMPGGPATKALSILGGSIGGHYGRELGQEVTPNSGWGPMIGGMLGGAAGGMAGGGLATAGRRMGTTPRAANLPDTDPVHKAMVQTLERFGVQPSAGDFRGSHGLQKLEQVGGLLGGGGKYEANKLAAERQLTQAGLKLMGETGDVIMPGLGVAGTAKESAGRIGNMFDEAEKRIKVVHDQKFQDRINDIKIAATRDLAGDDLAKFGKLLDQLNPTTSPGSLWFRNSRTGNMEMKGGAYKTFTEYDSLIDTLSKSGGRVSKLARDVRTVLDDQLRRSAKTPRQKEGLTLLEDARKQWYNRGIILDSVNESGEAARKGLIDPKKLAKNAAGADESTELAQLAMSAGGVMTAPKPGSMFSSSHETGQGMLRHGAQAGAAGLGAGLGFAVGGFPGMAVGAAGPGLFGRAVNTKAMQNYLKNVPLGTTRREREIRAAVGAVIGSKGKDERKKPVRQKRPGAIYDE